MNVHPEITQKYSTLKLEQIQFLIQTLEDFAIPVTEEFLQCLAASLAKHETEARERVWVCEETLQRIVNISYSLKVSEVPTGQPSI